jgi:hypothetical protein
MSSPETAQRVIDVTAVRGIVVVQPEQSELWKLARSTADNLTMVDGASFSNAFNRAYKYAPDDNASRGYIAARLISGTVRSLNQNPVQDLDATRNALQRVQNRLPE